MFDCLILETIADFFEQAELTGMKIYIDKKKIEKAIEMYSKILQGYEVCRLVKIFDNILKTRKELPSAVEIKELLSQDLKIESTQKQLQLLKINELSSSEFESIKQHVKKLGDEIRRQDEERKLKQNYKIYTELQEKPLSEIEVEYLQNTKTKLRRVK